MNQKALVVLISSALFLTACSSSNTNIKESTPNKLRTPLIEESEKLSLKTKLSGNTTAPYVEDVFEFHEASGDAYFVTKYGTLKKFRWRVDDFGRVCYLNKNSKKENCSNRKLYAIKNGDSENLKAKYMANRKSRYDAGQISDFLKYYSGTNYKISFYDKYPAPNKTVDTTIKGDPFFFKIKPKKPFSETIVSATAYLTAKNCKQTRTSRDKKQSEKSINDMLGGGLGFKPMVLTFKFNCTLSPSDIKKRIAYFKSVGVKETSPIMNLAKKRNIRSTFSIGKTADFNAKGTIFDIPQMIEDGIALQNNPNWVRQENERKMKKIIKQNTQQCKKRCITQAEDIKNNRCEYLSRKMEIKVVILTSKREICRDKVNKSKNQCVKSC